MGILLHDPPVHDGDADGQMNDPHVESLRYRFEPTEGNKFDAPPIVWDTAEVHFDLGNGYLIARPKVHYPDIEHALADIDPLVWAWEVEAGIKYKQREFRFRFVGGEVIDRRPTPGVIESSGTMTATGSLSAVLTRGNYPPPPGQFTATPDVLVMWERYARYREGAESLPSMAYFCLTVFNGLAGGITEAASEYNISEAILKKLGNLTSTKGDPSMARKAPQRGPYKPLTKREIDWLETAVLAIIRRLGEAAISPTSLRKITMADLPSD